MPQALSLFKVSLSEGHFTQQHWDEKNAPPARAEINLHAMTAGVAMLSLFCWLMRLRYLVTVKEASLLPARFAIITDKGKGSKEQGNLVVKEAVAAIMALWQAPFRSVKQFFLPYKRSEQSFLPYKHSEMLFVLANDKALSQGAVALHAHKSELNI